MFGFNLFSLMFSTVFNTVWLLLLALLTLLTLAAYAGEGLKHQWLLDVINPFRLQYTLIAFLVLGFYLVRNRFRLKSVSTQLQTGLLIALVSLNFIQVAPYYVPSAMAKPQLTALSQQNKTSAQTTEPANKKLKLLHINLLWINRDTAKVTRVIQEKNPDVLSFAEYSVEWQAALEQSGTLSHFPYRNLAGDDSARIAIYSKYPLNDKAVDYADDGQRDMTLVNHLQVGGEPVTLLAAHPRPPITPGWMERQHQQVQRWINQREHYGQNVILVGDLNMTPWSYAFQQLVSKTDLRDTQIGRGVQPSWPSILPSFAAIPIDHVLTSPTLATLKRETVGFVGSDHLPIYVELALPSASDKP